MHNTRTARVLTARDAPPEKRVHQRPRTVPGPGMHHEPRRLVHDQLMLVLEDYRNGYLFRRDALLRHPRLDALPAAHPVRGNNLLAIDEYQPSLYYALNSAAADS